MKNRERLESLFKQIAEGFNLTEGEITETLKLRSEGLKAAIRDCFKQIEHPRQKFSEEDYDYLTKEIGCVNLEEQLENEPLNTAYSIQELIIATIFNLPIKFTESELLTQLYLSGYNSGDMLADIVAYTLDLLSHPKVKYLIKDGDEYSLNLNAKIG